jgi:hypothetical protein
MGYTDPMSSFVDYIEHPSSSSYRTRMNSSNLFLGLRAGGSEHYKIYIFFLRGP